MTLHRRLGHLAWIGLLLSLATPARAGISVALGSVQAEAWAAEAVSLQLADGPSGAYQLLLRAARIRLPVGEWHDLQLSCPALRVTAQAGYHCDALQLTASTPQGPQQLSGTLSYRDPEHWSLALSGLRLAGGQWQISATGEGGWSLALRGEGLTVPGALALMPQANLPEWDWRGRLDLTADITGSGAQVSALNADLRLKQGGWASPDGLQAGEGLAARLRLQADRRGDAWYGRLRGELPSGQLYADPVFVDLASHPLGLVAAGRLPDGGNVLQLDSSRLALGKLLSVTAGGHVPLAQPTRGPLHLAADLPDLATVYPVLLQPLAFGTALDKLQLAGGVALELDWRQGAASVAQARIDDLHLDDTDGRFGIAGLTGQLHWQAQGQTQTSRLSWNSGHLYRVDFGPSTADVSLVGDGVSLAAPLSLPLLDGKLHIPALSAAGLAGDAPHWRAALTAESLSLPLLTQALGWPVFGGDLSVEIPAVRYGAGVLALEGELTAEAFDGTVRVTGLELREPLSPAPVFAAEASLRGLDLERLTRVFDFGRITGRLEGDVRNLQLVGWQPVAFQAQLQSPVQDDLPHRISQRAVENLTALGNNGAAALSGTFLRVFESFSYDRLMLKVDLNGQRARLDGIPHPSGGYYLVKGAGLPRIDVIGRNRDVAWRDLVERLRRIQLRGAEVR